MTKSLRDVISLCAKHVFTPDELEAITEKVRVADERFEREHKAKTLTQEDLNKAYTI